MSEKGLGGGDRSASEAGPMNPGDYEAFARNYLAYIASAMYHFAQGGGYCRTSSDIYKDINLAQLDVHGNLSKSEFDTYRIEYKASENGGIGECHVYKIVPGEDDQQEATMQEITAQGANLDTCNTLGRICNELAVSRKSKD